MSRKTTAYARKCKRQPYQPDALAGLRALDHSRTYEPGEMTAEHVKTRAAFERLRTGHGDEGDFDRVSMILNVGLIRAESIDVKLVRAIQAGQMSFVRMKDRFLRGLGFGFDADGLRDAPEALEVYEAIMDSSSPLQMKLAIREAYVRIIGGELLGMTA